MSIGTIIHFQVQLKTDEQSEDYAMSPNPNTPKLGFTILEIRNETEMILAMPARCGPTTAVWTLYYMRRSYWMGAVCLMMLLSVIIAKLNAN